MCTPISSEARRRRRAAAAHDDAQDLLLHPRHTTWQPSSSNTPPPCQNRSRYVERPRVSALIQTFGDGRNAQQLATRLIQAHGVDEIIVNDDSGNDHGEWLKWLRRTHDVVLSLPNVHEVRAYNRMARLARGDFLLLLQGDHCVPPSGTWLAGALSLFDRFPKLGMVGGQMGFDEVPRRKIAEKISWGVPPCKPIPFRTAARDGMPFMFVAGVNIGPLLVRRDAFLRAGSFDEAFSCPGDPGIQLDTELSLQLWRHGYQVGLWYSGVANGVGGRKTRKNPAQKRARNRNDVVNAQRCDRLMKTHDAALVAAANAQLARVDGADAVRTSTYKELGMQGAGECAAPLPSS